MVAAHARARPWGPRGRGPARPSGSVPRTLPRSRADASRRYPPLVTQVLAHARPRLPRARRPLRLRPDAEAGPARSWPATSGRRSSAIVERLPATVESWSEGYAALDPLDVIEVRRPITGLSSSGGGRWWVGPREVRDGARRGGRDRRSLRRGLRALARTRDVPRCGWGCTLGPAEPRRSAPASRSISTDHWRASRPTPIPPRAMSTSGCTRSNWRIRSLGLTRRSCRRSTTPATSPRRVRRRAAVRPVVCLRCTTTPAARTWRPWYRDWMTGQLRPVDDTRRRSSTCRSG